MHGVHWNYTTVLNILAVITFAGLYWLYRNRERVGGGAGYATDPVCGMQVDHATAPATATRDGQSYYFCSDHCQHRFTTRTPGTEVVDPVHGTTGTTGTTNSRRPHP
jgi:YHS domain-containing protein